MDQVTIDSEQELVETKESILIGKKQSRVSNLIAALLPFLQSIPPLTVWGGLMTIPFISYLAFLLTSSPTQFLEALFLIFFGGFPWEQLLALLGIGLLIYSVVYMRVAKKKGLIMSGPYRFVRHPQYTGVVLFTLALTTRSYWIGKNTFGMSWISPELTVAIWFGTLFAYIGLALVEELHLLKIFAQEYEEYREKTGFLIPLVRSQSRVHEIIISVLVLGSLLFAIILLAPAYPPLL